MTWSMRDEIVAYLPPFSPESLHALQCSREIPECKNDVQLQCAVHGVMHAGSNEILAHLLCFSTETTSFTIVLQRHCIMQGRRTATMFSSCFWCTRTLRMSCSPASSCTCRVRLHHHVHAGRDWTPKVHAQLASSSQCRLRFYEH